MSNPHTPTVFDAPEPARLAPLFPGYEIEHLIAKGGMGAVYKANQISLARPAAIKILPREFGLDASFRASFEAEARAMGRLNHPNLISVYDFGEVDGMLFIVMEFVPGSTLYQSAHGKPIAPADTIRIVSGVCAALAHAHTHGILHRDIKPANILLDLQARPKLGDFGLARPIGASMKDGETIFGTPHYTAPEVLKAPNSVDARADIFSVGVVLHELLTGRLPAADSRPASLICNCDVRFDAIIRKATQPTPAMRYASVAEIIKDLNAIGAPPAPGVTARHRANQIHKPRPGAPRKFIARTSTQSAADTFTYIMAVIGGIIAAIVLAYFAFKGNSQKPARPQAPAPEKSAPATTPAENPPSPPPAQTR